MDKGHKVRRTDGESTMEDFRRMMGVMLETGEVRCPKCGKLLLKGGFNRGTWIDLRCTNNKCVYHKVKLMVVFQ